MNNKQPIKKTTDDNETKRVYDHQEKFNLNFNNEREVTEATIHNRFNFLLLTYSLFINSYFMDREDKSDKIILLVIGLIIVSLLFFGILKSYIRFRILLKTDKTVIPFMLKKFREKRGYRLLEIFFPPIAIIGWIVPFVMIATFVLGILNYYQIIQNKFHTGILCAVVIGIISFFRIFLDKY